MGITHAFSSPVADVTGTVTVWAGATTATVAASQIVQASQWNDQHNIAYDLGGNTLGVSQVTGSNIVLAGGANITLSGIQGANVGTISISGGAGGAGGGVAVSAAGSSVSSGTVVFSNSNNVSFGQAGSTVTASASFAAQTSLSFVNSNGVSFGIAGSTVTATVQTNYLTTARASNDGIGLNTAQTNVTWTVNSSGISFDAGGYNGTGFTSTTTAGTQVKATNNTAGLSMAVPAFLTTALTTARASNDAIGLNTAQTNVTWTVNSSGLSFNAGGYNGTGFTSTTTAGTAIVATNNTAGLSLAFPTFITNAITTARASTDAIGLNTAQSNVTWTVNSSGLSFDARGYAGTGTTFNGANLSGSITQNSAGLQLSLSAAAGAAGNVMSFYENVPQVANQNSVALGASSWIHPFILPLNISAGYLRFVVQGSTNSTSLATSANTTFSCSRFSTVNAVIYTQNTGASSLSLVALASGSAGISEQWSLQANANGSEYTVTLNVTYPITGTTVQYTTSYATTQTRFDFSTNSLTLFTGSRFVDIPFSSSLAGSNYWMVVGVSTTTSTQAAGVAGMTNLLVALNNFMCLSNQNNPFLGLGVASNSSIAMKPGLGSITAGAQTTASLALANVSSNLSNIYPYFQIIRQA